MFRWNMLVLARVYGSVTSSFTPGSIGGVGNSNGLGKIHPSFQDYSNSTMTPSHG